MNTEQTLNTIFEMVLSIDNKFENLSSRVDKLSNRVDKLTGGELPSITFREFTENYYCKQYEYRMNGAERLHKLRKSVLNRIIRHFGDMNLQDITVNDIHSWVAHIEINSKVKIQPVSIQRYCTVVRAVLNKAIKFGFLHKNIINDYDFKVQDNVNQRVLTDEEIEILLQESTQSRNKDLYLTVQIALNTGLRSGEIDKLKKNDIQTHRNCVYIKVRAENAKSSKERIVPLNNTIYQLLMQHIQQLKDSDFIFATTSEKAFVALVKKIKEKYNIPHFRFHDLRHTFATRLIERKVQPNDVRVLLGHSTMRLTERYMHYNLENLANAVNLL